jgi:hypothetical protein
MADFVEPSYMSADARMAMADLLVESGGTTGLHELRPTLAGLTLGRLTRSR